MTPPQVGEIWRTRGIWDGEPLADVRIVEVMPSGNVDANYELDESKPQDLRILPRGSLLYKVPG